MTTTHSHAAPRAHAVARAIALFGGTFDPIHAGHLAVAQAALRRLNLDTIHFIPSARPPHKAKRELTPYLHRYAMVALACAEHGAFIASAAEAGPDGPGAHAIYSIDTVRKFHREGAHEHLFFIVGADCFLEIPTWKSYEALLDSCDFIIASRPGFRLDALRLVIPPKLLGRTRTHDAHTISLRRTKVHLLSTVASHVSSTEIRRRRRNGQSIHGLVPPRVEEYILEQALYR